MIQRLKELVQGRSATPPQPQPEPRTAAQIRAELAGARGAAASVAERLAQVEADVSECQGAYDRALEQFAIGAGPQPDREGLQVVCEAAEALRCLHADLQSRITRLDGELPGVELAEVIAAGKARLPALIAAAEAKADEIERALTLVQASERELFEMLFSESAGLKQFADPDLAREARLARGRLRKRMEALGQRFRYEVDWRFETDGLPNLGREEAWMYQWQGVTRRETR